MNKKLRIAIDIALIIVGVVLLVFGIRDAYFKIKDEEVPDALIFKKSYDYVDSDNSYKYVTLKEAYEMLEGSSGVLLIGSPKDTWTQVLVKPLDEIAKSYDIDIYYLEIDNIDDTSDYFADFPIDLGNIDTPIIVIVKDGKILADIEKSDIYDAEYEGTPIEYFDEEHKEQLANLLVKISDLN